MEMDRGYRKKADIILVLILVAVIGLFVYSYAVHHNGLYGSDSSGVSAYAASVYNANTFQQPSDPSPQQIIISNENENNTPSILSIDYIYSYVEEFFPGTVSGSSCGYYSQLDVASTCRFLGRFEQCIAVNTPADFTYTSSSVGWFGYPQSAGSVPAYPYELLSASFYRPGLSSLVINYYYDRTDNFAGWTNTVAYPFGHYAFAINYSFPFFVTNPNSGDSLDAAQGGTPTGSATFLIPSLSCGSTFLLTSGALFGSTTNNDIQTLSGFTPSVGEASNIPGGVPALYALFPFDTGGLVNPFGDQQFYQATGMFSYSAAYFFDSSFNFTEPGLNYANFPAGNKGDKIYYNVSDFFATPINYIGGTGRLGYAYESKDVILTYQTTSGSPPNITYALTKSNVSAYTVPNLESGYFPNILPELDVFGHIIKPQGVLIPAFFKIDGILPICSYQSGSYEGPSCTFENGSSVNQISPYRIWDYEATYSPPIASEKVYKPASYSNTVLSNPTSLSGYSSTPAAYVNDIEYNPYTPGYAQNKFNTIQNPLNIFESRVMDSFCFYNDSFNQNTGQYDSPGYTRIIPPTQLENYSVAIGECNGLFNNTNCFTTVSTSGTVDSSIQSGNYMNFKYGVFVGDPTCTKYGIVPYNVTDAWISSIAIANNGGQYCGLFGGQKNMSNPLANSTLFTLKSYSCPSFNSNSSVVPLIVTVKNVGNGNIISPYLVVLYNNTNISRMFYSDQQSPSTQLGLYQNFLDELSSVNFNSVFQIRYINGSETAMYVTVPSNQLQDMPIAQIFQNSPYGYINGPYNNSLLGMWIYYNGHAIRSANTFMDFANSSDTGLPVIAPGGTASFTVNIPMAVFEKLMKSGENISVFFGNTFNVSFYQGIYHTYGPEMVASSTENASAIHNGEYLNPNSSKPSPIWQYIVSYKFNLTSMPFANVSVYDNSFNFSVSALKNTTQKLNVSFGLTVSKLNGTGYYPSIPQSDIVSSRVACFASQDNLNDFSIYWSVQPSSPSDINYLLKAVYGQTSPYQSEVITRWRGILFMPYASPVVLNYNNVPYYPGSTVSFQTQSASIEQSQATYYKEVLLYFGSGQESSLYSNLNGSYFFFNHTAHSGVAFSPPLSIPGNYGFKLIADAASNYPSIIRIASMKVLTNPNPFSGVKVVVSPQSGCSFPAQTLTTNPFGVVNLSSSYINDNCRSTHYQNYTILIQSTKGPFTVSMYNSSSINISNTMESGAFVVAANFTRGSNATGYYNTTLIMPNSSVSLANGVSFRFSYTPLSTVNKNVNAYLYYINNTPFSCSFVNYGVGSNDTSVSQISPGEYNLGDGQIFCQVSSGFSYIRAVLLNASNGGYIGSGDVGSGLAVQYLNSTRFYVTYNGLPVYSQNATMLNITQSQTSTCFNGKIITDGILNTTSNYPGSSCSGPFTGSYSNSNGFNYELRVYVNSSGTTSPISIFLANITDSKLFTGNMIARFLDVVEDDPSTLQNISFSSAIPSGLPIQFVLPSAILGSSCDLLRVTEYGSYPYEELPYQVVSSSNNACVYVFTPVVGKQNYTLLEGTSQPPIAYPSNWLNYTMYNGYYRIRSNQGSFNLFPECRPGYGPCISNMTVYGRSVGDTLVNNVSVEPSSVSVSLNSEGPIMDCFDVSFTSSQTVNNEITGFGQINYDLNKLYLTGSPTEEFISSYCFFNNGNIVLDAIYGQGNPVNFYVGNSLNGNFSLAENSNLLTLNVSKPLQTSCNQYSSVTYKKLVPTYSEITSNPADYFNSHCLSLLERSQELSHYDASVITAESPVSLSPNENGFYCIYNGTPATYSNNVGTSPPSLADNTNLTTELGFLYNPGNYNITFSTAAGVDYTLTYYGLCRLPPQSTDSYTGYSYNVLSSPQFYVNGVQEAYSSSQSENREMNDTIASPYSEVLFKPNGGTMINSCPVNTTIASYTPCVSQLSFAPLSGAGYGGLECIPTASTTGSNYPAGGGCLIDSTYSCAPTAGTISNSYPGNYSSDSSTVSSTGNLPFNYSTGSRIPTSSPSTVAAYFSCSGSANVTESITIENTSNTTQILGSCEAWTAEPVSCSYSDGSTSGNTCSPAFITPGTMNENPLSFISECSMSLDPNYYSNFSGVGNCPTGSEYTLVPYSVVGVSPLSMSISPTSLSFTQSEPTVFNPKTFLCGNKTNNIAINVNDNGWSWAAFDFSQNNIPTTGVASTLPDIGACEACRYTYNISNPDISSQNVSSGGVQYTYSCSSGSGSILACQEQSIPARSSNQSLSYAPASCTSSIAVESLKTETFTSNSPNYGATCLSCSALPSSVNASAYEAPNPQYNCFAYANPKNSTTQSSFVLQYSYPSDIGVGLGVINSTSPLNVYIPGNNNAKIKDFYMTSLSVSQKELINEFTQLYPFKPLESAIESVAMFESPLYPYDLLSTLLLQYPYFAISGVPSFVNGSELDYAMNLFTGGTQGNCPGSLTQGNDGIFSLGEGALCDGSNLPSTYSNGIYLLLGGLNEGLHSIQFYSVKNSSINAPPTVSVYSSGGVATNLAAKCSNGNSRIFSAVYSGAGAGLNITSDEDCNRINSALYGYIVNCVYQGNNNQTYAIYSDYYLAYNLPTVWNISYTLLVSPKSYNVVPVPIYQINTSSGSHLSIYQPSART